MILTPSRVGIALGILLIVSSLGGCGDDSDQQDATVASSEAASPGGSGHPTPVDEVLSGRITKFCGDCHAVPQASSFPRDNWYEEVKRGYDFWFASRRTDIIPPPMQDVVDWYRERAPEVLPSPSVSNSPSKLSFTRRNVSLSMPSADGRKGVAATIDAPAVSFLGTQPLSSGELGFLVSDMRGGGVFLVSADGVVQRQWSGTVRHPAAVCQCDLNGNNQPDFVISDLGSFLPEDHDRGMLCWYPDETSDAPREPVQLAVGLGRIADVRPADFNNDGDQDLVLAEFGLHATGGIHVLMNENGDVDTADRFTLQTLDDRAGAIHVPTVDLNNDGRMDFIALISQEFETVTAFVNEEHGFRKVALYDAPDPAFGSSGIEIVDLDADGDPDILLTNGDTFDSHLVKPYHGITWLENVGDLEFTARHLTAMPGVHRAIALDLDDDGDLDIVGSAFLSDTTISKSEAKTFDSLIWLEQMAPGEFHRHVIEHDRPTFATVVVSDFDDDGDEDIAAGFFHGSDPESAAALAVFRNQITGN